MRHVRNTLLGAVALALSASCALAGLNDIRPRPQQMGLLSQTPLAVHGAFYLVMPDDPTVVEAYVRDEAIAQLTTATGMPPVSVSLSDWNGEGVALLVGQPERFPQLVDSLVASGLPGMGVLTREEEYQLLVGPNNIFLAGYDHIGMNWGLMSFVKLISIIYGDIYVDRAYIRDWPDYPKRICTLNNSVRTADQIAYCDSVTNMAYRYKMDEIEWTDVDLGLVTNPHHVVLRERFDRRGQFFTAAVDKAALRCKKKSWQEGVPVTNMQMTVTSSGFTANSLGLALANSGFESWTGNVPNSWSMYPASSYGTISRDNTNRHSGSSSLKWGNTDPNYYYDKTVHQRMYFGAHRLIKVKFWTKTQNFTGRVLFRIIGDEPVNNLLENRRYSVSQTATWTQYEAVFSTYNLDTMSLWIGPEGGSGDFWLDDLTIEPAGFSDMIRRMDTPVTVYRQPGNILMSEGTDYLITELSDTTEENYVFRPRITRTSTGGLPLNSTVSVNWYTAGKYHGSRETECFSMLEPIEYYQRTIQYLDSAHKPDGFKIHINEVSLSNYDPLCTSSGLSCGQLCGRYCARMCDAIWARRPGAPIRIYGDAFDIFVQDPRAHPISEPPWTTGSLQMLSPQVEIMAMSDYSANLDSSFAYFNRNGHPATMAAYGSSPWTLAYNGAITARRYPNCTGFQFYDWDLSAHAWLLDFSCLGWNFGPYFIHTPVEYTTRPDTVFLTAEIWTDSFRVNQQPQITSRSLTYKFDTQANWTTITPVSNGPRAYSAAIVVPANATNIQYYYTATDHRAQTRKLPPEAPTRFFTANFPETDPGGGWDPRRLDRAVRVRISGRMIEWDPVPDATAYEIHATTVQSSDYCRRNQTMLAVQSPSQPRYYLDPEIFPKTSATDISVIARFDSTSTLPPAPIKN